jgi:hypothetical protein
LTNELQIEVQSIHIQYTQHHITIHTHIHDLLTKGLKQMFNPYILIHPSNIEPKQFTKGLTRNFNPYTTEHEVDELGFQKNHKSAKEFGIVQRERLRGTFK